MSQHTYTDDVRGMNPEEIHEKIAERTEAIWKHQQQIDRLKFEKGVLEGELKRREERSDE